METEWEIDGANCLALLGDGADREMLGDGADREMIDGDPEPPLDGARMDGCARTAEGPPDRDGADGWRSRASA